MDVESTVFLVRAFDMVCMRGAVTAPRNFGVWQRSPRKNKPPPRHVTLIEFRPFINVNLMAFNKQWPKAFVWPDRYNSPIISFNTTHRIQFQKRKNLSSIAFSSCFKTPNMCKVSMVVIIALTTDTCLSRKSVGGTSKRNSMQHLFTMPLNSWCRQKFSPYLKALVGGRPATAQVREPCWNRSLLFPLLSPTCLLSPNIQMRKFGKRRRMPQM